MTNLDVIKAFTAEEMAELICSLANRESCAIVPYHTTIEWLESEAEEK